MEGEHLGKYFNPGNIGFENIIKKNYVDKTGMIDIVNDSIGTSDNLICVSRPRRFGKSFVAQMLTAYYDCSCDSHSLFDDYNISKCQSYEEHINRYNVITIDVTGFISDVQSSNGEKKLSEIPNMIARSIRNEIVEMYPEFSDVLLLEDCLLKCVDNTGRKFVFVIDEWDALIREAKNDSDTQKAYLNFLRGLFKNANVTPKAIALAYMTGILPIKKDGTESALSDFDEYSILDSYKYAEYIGFTDDEVERLCKLNKMNIEEVRYWYNGYSIGGSYAIYNPYSVMQAIKRRKCKSYWKKTTAAETLTTYINMNFDGLQEDVLRLIAGESIEVHTEDFANDVETFHSRDDVLTLLIHLGYLAYDEDNNEVRIPNEEVREEFNSLIRKANMNKLAELIKKSDKLLSDTIACDEDSVAIAIERIRESNYAPNYYNDEQALRYVIKFAYIVCVDRYLKIEELPSGKGIADVVFLPKKNTDYPAIVIELKWNKTDEAAIAQIKNKRYPVILKDYAGEILLVGINYNAKSKEHSCRIEKIG